MDVKSCEAHSAQALKDIPRLRSLYEALSSESGKDKEKFRIGCCDCSQMEGMAGSFARAYFSAPHVDKLDQSTDVQEEDDPPEIVLCTNRLHSQYDVTQALTHEMVHAVDHCVLRRDLSEPCGLACSEIRAARESECRDNFGNVPADILCSGILGENPRSNETKSDLCAWLKKRCVVSTAKQSVEAVFPGQGKRAVAEMLPACYRDLSPN